MSIVMGKHVEQAALRYLEQHGLKLVNKNFYSRQGEIDLIMRDGDFLVFIEVRSRKNSRYGGALASITPLKQRKIIKTAEYYLLKHRIGDRFPLRFDVIVSEGDGLALNWIKNAFGY